MTMEQAQITLSYLHQELQL